MGVSARRYLTAQECSANFHSLEERRIGAVREDVAAIVNLMTLESARWDRRVRERGWVEA